MNEHAQMTDYQHYLDNLAGKEVEFHEGDPQCGFYKKKAWSRGDRHHKAQAVAIWRGEDGLLASQGRMMVDPLEIWTFVCRNPIEEDAYHKALENGFEEDIKQDDILEAYKVQIEELTDSGIDNDEKADIAANIKAALRKKFTELEKQRKEEKQPHIDAGNEIDQRFKSLQADVTAVGLSISEPLETYLKEKARKEREAQEAEQRKIREEQEAARQKAIDERKNDIPEVDPIAQEPVSIVPQTFGTQGRKATLKVVKTAEILDIEACFAFFKNDEVLIKRIQLLANAEARQGNTVPGMKIIEEEKLK